ncbi:hypothetical protein CDV36_015437 [Fusarium kuroshium]|uniref:Uncharacterized protein n=1 Tax=Fusarium kuroshium TaxID=2010991 RepID=A0A3M2RAH3_9HYPO|nr:hypothetical protein CDV36_015437 [Fusarium kuroshium]
MDCREAASGDGISATDSDYCKLSSPGRWTGCVPCCTGQYGQCGTAQLGGHGHLGEPWATKPTMFETRDPPRPLTALRDLIPATTSKERAPIEDVMKAGGRGDQSGHAEAGSQSVVAARRRLGDRKCLTQTTTTRRTVPTVPYGTAPHRTQHDTDGCPRILARQGKFIQAAGYATILTSDPFKDVGPNKA